MMSSFAWLGIALSKSDMSSVSTMLASSSIIRSHSKYEDDPYARWSACWLMRTMKVSVCNVNGDVMVCLVMVGDYDGRLFSSLLSACRIRVACGWCLLASQWTPSYVWLHALHKPSTINTPHHALHHTTPKTHRITSLSLRSSRSAIRWYQWEQPWAFLRCERAWYQWWHCIASTCRFLVLLHALMVTTQLHRQSAIIHHPFTHQPSPYYHHTISITPQPSPQYRVPTCDYEHFFFKSTCHCIALGISEFDVGFSLNFLYKFLRVFYGYEWGCGCYSGDVHCNGFFCLMEYLQP